MLIDGIQVNNVRNITDLSIKLHPRLSLVLGANGAGKSSLIESLSILSTSRSFRTQNISKVIQIEKSSLTASVKLFPSNVLKYGLRLGINRERSGNYVGRIDGEPVKKLADITSKVPVILIYPGFYDLVASKRAERLKLIDWGLFHVEPKFYSVWVSTQKVLKQRNKLLKQIKERPKANYKVLDVFDTQLIEASRQLTELRKSYLNKITPLFLKYMNHFAFDEKGVALEYIQGWPSEISFEEQLSYYRDSDVNKGYTQFGCHRADIKVSINGSRHAFDIVSRGQQKMLVNGIMLAITDYMVSVFKRPLLVCVDDLPSELDKLNQKTLIDAFLGLDNTQLLLTAIDENSLPEAVSGYNMAKFHVEHGLFEQVQ